jgi:hypothetical protein
MTPRLNRAKASGPAMGRRASAAWAVVAMSRTPAACRVTAVVSMMKKATRFENAMPTKVSQRIRSSWITASASLLWSRSAS